MNNLTRLSVACGLVLTLGACTDPDTIIDREPIGEGAKNISLIASLKRFDACDDFLSHVKKEAIKHLGEMSWGPVVMEDGFTPVSGEVMPSASAKDSMGGEGDNASRADSEVPTSASPEGDGSASAATGGDIDESTTGTNNQESGVDEADIIKTDGTRVLTLRGSELIVTELVDGAPYITHRVALPTQNASSGSGGDTSTSSEIYPYPGEYSSLNYDRLFLRGDQAFVIGSGWGQSASPASSSKDSRIGYMPQGYSFAVITEVSLKGTPAVASTKRVEGSVLDGRMANGAVRLVLSSSPSADLPLVYPQNEAGVEAAQRANEDAINQTKADDWLPALLDENGTATGPAVDCNSVYRPAEYSGLSMLTLLTIRENLDATATVGLLADSQTTYASTENLYVSTSKWLDPSTGETTDHTDIHRFAIPGTDAAVYQASGRVDGTLLNQYSMSEFKGNLRIATTVTTQRTSPQPPTGDVPPPGAVEPQPAPAVEPQPAPAKATSEADIEGSTGVEVEDPTAAQVTEVAPWTPPTTDSQVVVLGRSGKALVELGKVKGLGPGESITSVRFDGPTGYVVTFERKDPLYVIDLNDPAKPTKVGELKLPGFSSYLHPVGPGLLLGVGSDATDDGRVTGAKVTLFDATDPAAPKEITSLKFADKAFMSDYDPKAFHFDATRGLVFLPYSYGCWDLCENWTNESGVLVLSVADRTLGEVTTINHNDRTPPPPRPGEPIPDETTTVPDTTVPDTTVPGTTAPETTVPGTTTPGTTAPGTTAPGTSPETTVPGTTIPGAAVQGKEVTSAESSPASGGSGDVASSPPLECGPAVDCVAPEFYLDLQITRVFVVGDRVITYSGSGIAVHRISDWGLAGYAAF